MRAGSLLKWMMVALVLGFVVSGFLQQRRPTDEAAAPGEPPAPAARMAYALDTTRSTWPPLADQAPAPDAEPTAVNYYVVLDGSGSMLRSECSGGASKIAAAIAALTTFVQTLPPQDHLGLAVFDNRGLSERVPLGRDNRDAVAGQLGQVRAHGGTPLASAIQLAYERLTQQARRQLGYGEYHLVLVTDGHPEPSNEDPTDVVNRVRLESPVLLHTIGFCIGEDHVLNQPGRAHYMAADNPQQLQQGLESVLAEAPAFDVARFRQ